MQPKLHLPKPKLLKIAEEFGTPVYVYHAEQIQKKYKILTEAFKSSNVKFFYACKSLTNINILKYMQSLGLGIDCVSIQEVQLALMAGFKPQQIIFTPNCVHFQEYQMAVEKGVMINIDNIPILEQFGNTYGSSYPIFIRVNPHILEGGNFKISTGHIDSKFGISIHQLRHVERVIKSTKVKIHGLHVHTGSEIKDIDVFIKGLEVVLECSHSFKDIEFIDLGSGFKVPYKQGDYFTDVKLLASKFKARMTKFEKEVGKKFTIFFEPGKFLTSEAGYFIVQANVIKQTTATAFIGVNSGFNHLIRPMFYDAYHHIENISSHSSTQRLYTVVGNICETDTFATDRLIQETKVGDYLVFHNAGSYCFEMSSNFNSRFKPAEVLVQNNKVRIIRKRDTLETLLQNQIMD